MLASRNLDMDACSFVESTGFLFAFSTLGDSMAYGLRVMTFNVACIVCGHANDIGPLSERMAGIADTINRHDADLVNLQEPLTGAQASEL
jgi:hypothetical protein